MLPEHVPQRRAELDLDARHHVVGSGHADAERRRVPRCARRRLRRRRRPRPCESARRRRAPSASRLARAPVADVEDLDTVAGRSPPASRTGTPPAPLRGGPARRTRAWVGLTTALCAGEGYPTLMLTPSATRAAVGASSMVISTTSAPSRIRSSRPHERISSIVRTLRTVARGSAEPDGRLSSSSTSTPARASAHAAVSPAAPAPPRRRRTRLPLTSPSRSNFRRTDFFSETWCLSSVVPSSEMCKAGSGDDPEVRAAAARRRGRTDPPTDPGRRRGPAPRGADRAAQRRARSRSRPASHDPRSTWSSARGPASSTRSPRTSWARTGLAGADRRGRGSRCPRAPPRGHPSSVAGCSPRTSRSTACCTRWGGSTPTRWAARSTRWTRSGAAGCATWRRRLKEDGVLRDDVTQAQAADLLWMLTSFEAFDLLHTDRGMCVDRAADVIATTAERTLCK